MISLLFFANNANIFVFVTEYLVFVPQVQLGCSMSTYAINTSQGITLRLYLQERERDRMKTSQSWEEILIFHARTLNLPYFSPVWLQNILPDTNCLPTPHYLLDLLLHGFMKNCP